MRKNLWLLSVALLLVVPMPTFAQSRAFQYDLRGEGGLYSHTPADPGLDWTFIGVSPEAEWDVIAIDANSVGTLYGVELNIPLTLGTIDPATAVFTAVALLSGDTPPTVNAMTIDPSIDLAWISDGNGLWTLDLATGVCSLISETFTNTANGGTVATVFELATDGLGNFFAFDVTLDTLWSLDESTGDLTPLGVYPGPGNPNFSNSGLDFEPDTGLLYADVYTGGGTGCYGTWNTKTGVFTSILDHASFPLKDPRIGGPIACFGGTTFQVNFFLDTFLTYDTPDPAAGVTSIRQSTAPSLIAMDFNDTGSTLYAVDNVTVSLGTIDTSTGGFTLTVPLVGDFPNTNTAVGITCDASTGQFYLTSTTSLYTLDVTNGDTVLVGEYQGAPRGDDPDIVIEIACNIAGEMYIFSSGDDKLWSVDKATADVVEIGTLVQANAGNFLQGMDFDPATGELYASIYVSGGTGLYGTWDTTTGLFTTITRLEDLPADGDGYELKLAIRGDTAPQIVFAESLTVTIGSQNAGGLEDLRESDNVDLTIFRDPGSVTALHEFELTATSPSPAPAVFEFTLEGSVFARSQVEQRIEFFDYMLNEWEVVDTRIANRFVDLTITTTPGGDLSRFVDQTTNEIKARIRYRADFPKAAFASNTDRAVWTIQ